MRNKIYQHAGIFDEEFAQKYFEEEAENPSIYREPTNEEKIKQSIYYLYSLIDSVFNKRGNLIKKEETTKSNYKSFNQTLFGEHLGKYLKKKS